MKTPIAALVAVLVVAGCDLALPATGGAEALDGEWRLVEGSHHGDPLPVPDDAPITMTVEDGSISGRAACNIYGGDLVIDGDRLTVGAMSMTEMGCDPTLMDAESAYLAALTEADRWTRDGDRLTLSGATVDLTYDLVPPTPDAALVGTTWRLEGLITGDAVSSTMGEPATLQLRADGTLGGTTGCRTFEGRYELENGVVAVAELVNDDRACPGLEDQDEHVLAVIGSGFAYEIGGSRLTLTAGRLGLDYVADER